MIKFEYYGYFRTTGHVVAGQLTKDGLGRDAEYFPTLVKAREFVARKNHMITNVVQGGLKSKIKEHEARKSYVRPDLRLVLPQEERQMVG